MPRRAWRPTLMKLPVRIQRMVRLSGALLVSALIVAAWLVESASAGPRRATAIAASGCGDPVVDDSYDGFQIGVPTGWNLLTLGDLLEVSKNVPSVEAAIVYPAVLTSGLTAAHFFNVALGELRQDAAANGDAVSFHVTSTANGLPQASLQGRAGQVVTAGHASVSILSDATAHGSKVAVFSAYWAPPAELRTDQAALAAVGACYLPRRAVLFRVVQDPSFTYSIPPGWTVASEGQDTLTISQGTTAGASYLLTFVPPSTGVDSAPTLLAYVFKTLGIDITKPLVTVKFPSEVDSVGALEGFEYVEFTGIFESVPVHGLVSALSVSGSVGTSGVLRYALGQASAWNTDNGALRRIVGGIQHNFTEDLQQWEQLDQQWQSFGEQEQSFDNIINGVDLVEDPSTGQVFEAPYDAYSTSGPDGPGYYDSSGQKLTEVNPSA
jgi:hypothetical protein